MGAVSIACFLVLNTLSSNILNDSVTATGFGIAFYYGLTGFACTWYFRKELGRSLRNLVYVGLLPLVGGLILFVLLGYDLYLNWDPGYSYVGDAWLGMGPPVAMAVIALGIGIVLMLAQRVVAPEFFRRKTEIAAPGVLDTEPKARPEAAGA